MYQCMSQYIRIEVPFHKQSEKACMCFKMRQASTWDYRNNVSITKIKKRHDNFWTKLGDFGHSDDYKRAIFIQVFCPSIAFFMTRHNQLPPFNVTKILRARKIMNAFL